MVSCSILQHALSICIIKSDFSVYGSLSQSNVSSSMLLSGLEWLIYLLGMRDVPCVPVYSLDDESTMQVHCCWSFRVGNWIPFVGSKTHGLLMCMNGYQDFSQESSYLCPVDLVGMVHSSRYCFPCMLCRKTCFHLWLLPWLFRLMDARVLIHMICLWPRVSIDMV